MLTSHILNPQPEELIYDFCSGPGGKTTHLAQLMGNTGRIIAVDINSDRINLLKQNCQRLGVKIVKPICENIQNLSFQHFGMHTGR